MTDKIILRDALDKVLNAPPPQPICACGSTRIVENHGLMFPGQRNGLYCLNGHYLSGQDMPDD